MEMADGSSGTATAFLITDTGLMVTNNHVIAGARRIQAADDLKYAIPVVDGFYARDIQNDLALIQLDLSQAPQGFQAQPLQLAADTQATRISNRIVVQGYPSGVAIRDYSEGTITAIEDANRLRFDARINRGSSGSPLFDATTGDVIGVVTSFGIAVEELNFATRVEPLHRLLNGLQPDPSLQPFPGTLRKTASGGMPINLLVSLAFFIALAFGVRHLLARS